MKPVGNAPRLPFMAKLKAKCCRVGALTRLGKVCGWMFLVVFFPKKIATHPTMKGIPAHSLLVKVARGAFQRCGETT